MPDTDSSGGSDPGTNDTGKVDKGLKPGNRPTTEKDSSGGSDPGTVDVIKPDKKI
jgi:hypothetical protein